MTDLAVLTGYSAYGLRKLVEKNPHAIPGLKVEQHGKYRIRFARSSVPLKKWIELQSGRKWQRHYKRPKRVQPLPELEPATAAFQSGKPLVTERHQIEMAGLHIDRWLATVFRKHFATADRAQLEYWRDFLKPTYDAHQEIQRRLDHLTAIQGR